MRMQAVQATRKRWMLPAVVEVLLTPSALVWFTAEFALASFEQPKGALFFITEGKRR